MPDLRSRVPAYAPAAVVFVIATAGLVRVLMEHWRQGGVLIGGALLVAAALRTVLDTERAGLLAVRSRVLDVACYVGLGAAMILLSATIIRGQLTLT